MFSINYFVNEANVFIDSVENSNSSYFFYVARPQQWSNSSALPDDTAVTSANTSVTQMELELFDELLYGKRITPSDVNLVIPRHNWVANTVYARYDQNDANLYSKSFYVVTTAAGDQYNVYKCIDNNGNTASTIKPTLQTTTSTFKTGDGYTWKYMYTVDATANTKFTSTSYVPVTVNANVQGNAVPGTIDVVRLTNAGSGYAVYEAGLIDAVPDSFTIKLPNTASPLDNYYVNSSIYLKSGFGAGQVREIASYNGTTKQITLADSINTYLRLDFANSSLITGGTPGETIRQIFDDIQYTYGVGYVSSGANLIQTDTQVIVSVLTANTSALKVSRYNKTQSLSTNLILRDASDTGTLISNATHNKVDISTTTNLNLAFVVVAGTGYTANANVSISSGTGVGGAANATANATGKISTINITNEGNNYITEPTVTISAPLAQTFNSNTAVTEGTGEGANNVITLATAGSFVANDQIRYYTAAGNTVIGGLTNNTIYYVQFANSTAVALSATANTAAGNRIALTKGATETGHTLQGITAIGRIIPRSLFASNSVTSNLAAFFANGDFLRVGESANVNIRRIDTVNATHIIVDRAFANVISSANTFKITTGVLPTSISITQANAVISNTNLNSLRLGVSNVSVNGSFIIGERASFVSYSNVSLNANGTIAFANSTTIYLSQTLGTWSSGQKIRGEASGVTADVNVVETRPNVTARNPQGTFIVNQPVDFLSVAGANTGVANLASVVPLTEGTIEYEIGPTVKITGDGNGAVAIATVNTSPGTGNAVYRITVVDPGSNYTKANVAIYANSLYGTGATAAPVISPLDGHGADAASELGARYAGVRVKFDTLENESWYYPARTSFRKVGIIKDPKFANLTITTTNYNVVDLTLQNQSGTWQQDEVVLQATSNATGLVVSGNSTFVRLRDVRGTFVVANTLYAYSSGSTANVTAASLVRFTTGETITQANTGATAKVVSLVSNTTLYVSNVVGKFANGVQIVGANSAARATINAMMSADGYKTLTTTFADKFNQTARLTISSNTGQFQKGEYVVQSTTNAAGLIVSLNSDLDFTLNSVSGSFSIGDTIVNSNTTGFARVVFANSTHIRATAVSNTSLFLPNNEITVGLSANATIQSVYPVLILADVSKTNRFNTVANNVITGQNTGSVGTISSVTHPDLARESGKVLYAESSNTVVERQINTTEELRLIIKF